VLPNFLVPDQEVSKDGEGPPLPLDGDAAGTLQITLGITQVIEQESIDVQIFGSADGTQWTAKPVLSFPQKFYTGLSTLMLDLSKFPGTQHLRASWKVNRWGRGDLTPMFRFFVAAERLPSGPAA
jgi:hypothetical protein